MLGSIVAAMLVAAQPAMAPPRSPRCTFESLSAAEKSRYQSRYKRRVRIDGKAFADAWLQEQACPSAAQQTAKKKRLLDKRGRPCKRTRSEMRVTPGFDGPMTMTPIAVCAN